MIQHLLEYVLPRCFWCAHLPQAQTIRFDTLSSTNQVTVSFTARLLQFRSIIRSLYHIDGMPCAPSQLIKTIFVPIYLWSSFLRSVHALTVDQDCLRSHLPALLWAQHLSFLFQLPPIPTSRPLTKTRAPAGRPHTL